MEGTVELLIRLSDVYLLSLEPLFSRSQSIFECERICDGNE